MKVFKFGGASLKSAALIENILPIVEPFRNEKRLLIVVSAMGKTTNALEDLFHTAWNLQDYTEKLNNILTYHQLITEKLLGKTNPETQSLMQEFLQALQNTISLIIKQKNKKTKQNIANFDQLYDKLVSLGEWISSKIVYLFLRKQNFQIIWANAQQLIRTDSTWREAKVNFSLTHRLIKQNILPLLTDNLVITQGFIGANAKKQPTTLGREGSDYSAAIFASALNAQSLTIWKDVAGVLNADPKRFSQAQLFAQLSYEEAAEMSFYGASVIHPKTIAPLQQSNIPLYVKSFLQPLQIGTCINNTKVIKMIPAIMIKDNQTLITFSLKKINYLDTARLNTLIENFAQYNLKIYALQQTAFDISFCIDKQEEKIKTLQKKLEKEFTIKIQDNLQLVTIKNADETTIKQISSNKEIILQIQKENFIQLILKN
ncbi:MAG: aspartate kinase [Microscillaceae bacterium]|nr:aspartate kinase [Microscillaceae bacterium]MDW8460367.1 aspartate kinase [Cytophagales bacterium]